MFGRSLGEVDQPCGHITSGLTLAPFRGSGFGLISDPFWRRFGDSCWRSFGASKVSRKVAKRYTLRSKKEATRWIQNTKESNEEGRNQSRAERNLPRSSPNLESFRCTPLRCFRSVLLRFLPSPDCVHEYAEPISLLPFCFSAYSFLLLLVILQTLQSSSKMTPETASQLEQK